MSDPQPSCDLACQTKIIINGGSAAALIEAQCEGFQHFFNNGGKLKHSVEIIALLNDIEDKAVELQKLALKGMGYTGATGNMLD